jgi:malonate-semialdehyde dehydrogenase (acetylating)/methylmalonate-semialdehyde dehydrogenase
MAISVAVLVGDVADKLVPKLAERTKTLKVLNGTELAPRWAPSSPAPRTSASRATSSRA